MKRFLLLIAVCLLLIPAAFAEDDEEWYYMETVEIGDDGYVVEEEAVAAEPAPVNEAREDFIDRIVALGYDLYVQADGKAQSAHFKSDIYLCKNFTTHIFNELRGDFCIAEYPDVKLRIPNNLSEKKCRPYYYGLAWEDVAAEDGNPFYEAAAFRYDNDLSYEENLELAKEFMRQAQRGDFFQMSAKYEYGTGAHSAIMLGYDAKTDEIHWMDSNMRGHSKTVNGKKIRYGICQFDEVKSVEWWASTFCHKKRGATLYRLRNDIAYREEAQ